MKIIGKVKTETEKITVVLDTEDIIEYLKTKSGAIRDKLLDEGKTVVYVKVPSGGDWSNCNLEVGEETDIYVDIETEKVV